MNRKTVSDPVPGAQGAQVSTPPWAARFWSAGALAAQVAILFMTFLMGLGWGGVTWQAALAQAAAAIWLIAWLTARRKGPAVLAVPVVSLALTFGLVTLANTVTVACSGRALAAFEQLQPPPGVSVETFAGSQGCMAETRGRIEPAEVFNHYRNEFKKHEWRIASDNEEGMRAKRSGVQVYLYNAEGRVYFVLEED